MVWRITAEAIQVHGGYGYCSEYPVEQLAVDCKALSIVEGTNGIQSLDLVIRKILMDPGQYKYNVLKERIRRTIESAAGLSGRIIGIRFSRLSIVLTKPWVS